MSNSGRVKFFWETFQTIYMNPSGIPSVEWNENGDEQSGDPYCESIEWSKSIVCPKVNLSHNKWFILSYNFHRINSDIPDSV